MKGTRNKIPSRTEDLYGGKDCEGEETTTNICNIAECGKYI